METKEITLSDMREYMMCLVKAQRKVLEHCEKKLKHLDYYLAAKAQADKGVDVFSIFSEMFPEPKPKTSSYMDFDLEGDSSEEYKPTPERPWTEVNYHDLCPSHQKEARRRFLHGLAIAHYAASDDDTPITTKALIEKYAFADMYEVGLDGRRSVKIPVDAVTTKNARSFMAHQPYIRTAGYDPETGAQLYIILPSVYDY